MNSTFVLERVLIPLKISTIASTSIYYFCLRTVVKTALRRKDATTISFLTLDRLCKHSRLARAEWWNVVDYSLGLCGCSLGVDWLVGVCVCGVCVAGSNI